MKQNNISRTILNCLDTYQKWRDKKIKHATTSLTSIEIKKPQQLKSGEKQQLTDCIQQSNFALYQFNSDQHEPKSSVIAINKQLGLVDYDKHLYSHTDGLAEISPSQMGEQSEFIPYTNKALNWHTDGYYNPINQRIRAFSLFCVKQADNGGENEWIDHEMVYILLREKSPELAQILTQYDVMIVPEHQVNGVVIREKSVGAVFFIDELSGALMMRYTQRKHNIIWKEASQVAEARIMLESILDIKTQYHHRYKMTAGQGLVCHNIIHKRAGFSIGIKTQPRLMIRGRYFNRVIPNSSNKPL